MPDHTQLSTQSTDEAAINTAENRRRLRRFPAAKLSAHVKKRAGLFGRGLAVKAFDFTRAGLAIESNALDLKSNERVQVSLLLKLETGDIQITGLIAWVRNLQQLASGQRCGLEFDYQANRHMKSLETQAQLGRIEGILERSEAFRQRVAPASAKEASGLY